MYLKFNVFLFIAIYIILFTTCSDKKSVQIDPSLPQLERLDSKFTNIHFTNTVEVSIDNYSSNNNNLHAGGGIAVGDIDKDGLQDFVIISNQNVPGIFLNKGDFKFEDITESSGLKMIEGWSSGVVMEDINSDGYVDIYISRGIHQQKDPLKRKNLLYINNKNNTFSEKAAEYGIASNNATIQSVFFDFDLDGDLDLYLLNHPMDSGSFKVSELGKKRMDTHERRNSDILYRNDGNKYTDVSESMGITNWGNGLGIGISDFTGNGYPDIYICNDFSVDNFMYINKNGGGFLERNKNMFKHQSYFAMGVDIADINNDGLVDVFEVEMLPKERKRSIVNMESMNTIRFEAMKNAGFVPQYMRNSLNLNRGGSVFSEIAQISNVAKTDWSWGTLLMDLDDDGYKDILVTNGIARDVKDRDFVQRGNDLAKTSNGVLTLQQQLDLMVSTKVSNVAFQNLDGVIFKDKSKEWGFGDKGFSNGFVNADFDNDGDLDLLVNNINEEPWIYKNNSVEKGKNVINFKLNGSNKNPNGIGTKVKIYTKNGIQYAEQYVVRGFISSSQPLIHFGLGEQTKIDSLEIIWSGNKMQKINEPLSANKIHTLSYLDATANYSAPKLKNHIFKGASSKLNIRNEQKEVPYDDYEKELLLPHKLSQLGPALATADVNGDGIEDIFIGGAATFPARLYLSGKQKYNLQTNPIWESEKAYEDIAAEFFDADGDGDMDLYVGSGSNEFEMGSEKYQDRLYLNNGNGRFTKGNNKLPRMLTSTGTVKAADIDDDGDMDLFVGGRLVPGKYPQTPESYILINDNGKFLDKTKIINESIKNLGMVTSAIWSDYDDDGDKDLFIVGEWMGIKIFENNNGKLSNISEKSGLSDTEGWWFTIQEIDFDKDGDKDYVCGNIGLNHKFKTTKENPFSIYSDDFDENGKLDIVLAYHDENDNFFPVRGRDCSSEQMPFIKEKFPTFASFGEAEMEDIFGEKLDDAFTLKANLFASVILENKNGKFEIKNLPFIAQISAITGAEEFDFDQDGNNDLVVAGNMYHTEVETSRADASFGVLLLGDGKGNYKERPLLESGFFAPVDVKNIKMIDYRGQKLILIANNNYKFQSYITQFKKPLIQ